MFNRKSARFVALITALFMLASCSAQNGEEVLDRTVLDRSKPVELTTVKIGVLGPFTGDNASIGAEYKAAVELAFEPIDYRIGNYKVEIVYIDSKSDPGETAAAYERAITVDKIDLGFMSWDQDETDAALPISAEYKIPHFFAMGSSDSVTSYYQTDPEVYKYWIGNGMPSMNNILSAYYSSVEQTIERGDWRPRNRDFVVFTFDDENSLDFSSEITWLFEKNNWTMVDEVEFPDSPQSYAEIIAGVAETQASLFVGAVPPSLSDEAYRTLITEISKQEFPAVFIADGLANKLDFEDEAINEAADYMIDMNYGFKTDRAVIFAERFRTAYGYEPDPVIGGMCYDWANFLIRVMQTTLEFYGSITAETLTQCAVDRVVTGTLSFKSGITHKEYKFTADTFPDVVIGADYFMFPISQHLDGKMVTVWPDSQKTQSMRISPFARY